MMETRDPRVAAYIAKSTDFAQPILAYLREIVHDACPEVEETIKWGMPHLMYRGILCSMAAFNQHCAFDAFSPSHKREYVEWSRKPRARVPGSAGWTRPCSGWPRESHATGSTSNAEGWLDPSGIEPALTHSARD